MQAITLGRLSALAAVLALAGCGGKSTFEVSGNFTEGNSSATSAVRTAGLKLSLNGDQEQIDIPVGATSYRFSKRISYGENYTVKVVRSPEHVTCAADPNFSSGYAGQTTSIVVNVACSQNSYSVSGKVNNLLEDGLGLNNGATPATVNKASPVFTFPAIPYGAPYAIVVTRQPTNQTCTVVNGSGYMGEAAVTNVEINCTRP
ncbi:hypothetical protein [Pseudoduganella violacea]|uniref:Lipoprotein n=1 Tax=Pseudoduganella violacea TaxID=1715466 RepID=A0A7W5BB16_9BURK|nr:hypothetical protein [Pseudoduganella violacea]MBB3119836.1 hypothetical protein [Pseudoduganella violacea]